LACTIFPKEESLPEALKVRGEGKAFYSTEEVIIAYNEGRIDLHAHIKVKTNVRNDDGTLTNKLLDTTVGRVIFNQFVPKEVGFRKRSPDKEEPAGNHW
jgi:DNA-directed RNA polymerase subunit beta'